MRSALPLRHSAVTAMRPPGASRVKCVSGSCIGRMPASSSTVATQIAFEPDIGGVSSGSMMMKPICALGSLAGTSRLTWRKTPPRGSLRTKSRNRAVVGDEARLLPQGLARRRRDPADDHIADLALGMAGDDMDDLGGAHDLSSRTASSPLMPVKASTQQGLRDFRFSFAGNDKIVRRAPPPRRAGASAP